MKKSEYDRIAEGTSCSAMEELKRVCEENLVLLLPEKMNSDYMIYDEKRKILIIDPSITKKHIDMMLLLTYRKADAEGIN